MSNMLKCPNPSCPYVFDPSQVPVGVVLSCPRCAMQFTLGAPAAAPPPSTTAAYPPNQPQAPFPPTEPDLGAVVRPAGPASRASQRAAPRGDKSRDRQPAAGAPEDDAPRSNIQVYAIAGVVAVLLAGAAVAVVFSFMRKGETDGPGETVSKWPDLNAGVEALPPGWTRDDAMRVKVGSPYIVSFKRENPEAYVAFGANAFGSDHKKGRNPRPSEMKADIQQGLSKLFVTRGDESLRPQDPLANKWLGEPISSESPQYPNGFSFYAPSGDGVKWRGEVYAVAHKGMAYYWLGWCPEENFDGLKAEFASFRDKFRILELRKDWAPTQASVTDYKGDKVPYTFSDAEDVWKEYPVADEQAKEPELDKLLRLRITPRGNRHALPDEAELRVYVLDAGGDATDGAREFTQRMETDRIKLLNPDFKPPTFEILTGPEQGDPIATSAPRTAPIVRMQSKVAESREASRLYVTSGVRSGDKLVVLRCWCEWSKRSVLEARLTQIASSLRP